MKITVGTTDPQTYNVPFTDKDIIAELQTLSTDRYLRVFIWMVTDLASKKERAAKWLSGDWSNTNPDVTKYVLKKAVEDLTGMVKDCGVEI